MWSTTRWLKQLQTAYSAPFSKRHKRRFTGPPIPPAEILEERTLLTGTGLQVLIDSSVAEVNRSQSRSLGLQFAELQTLPPELLERLRSFNIDTTETDSNLTRETGEENGRTPDPLIVDTAGAVLANDPNPVLNVQTPPIDTSTMNLVSPSQQTVAPKGPILGDIPIVGRLILSQGADEDGGDKFNAQTNTIDTSGLNLVNPSEQTTAPKDPILSDIPIVGELFSSDESDGGGRNTEMELLIEPFTPSLSSPSKSEPVSDSNSAGTITIPDAPNQMRELLSNDLSGSALPTNDQIQIDVNGGNDSVSIVEPNPDGLVVSFATANHNSITNDSLSIDSDSTIILNEISSERPNSVNEFISLSNNVNPSNSLSDGIGNVIPSNRITQQFGLDETQAGLSFANLGTDVLFAGGPGGLRGVNFNIDQDDESEEDDWEFTIPPEPDPLTRAREAIADANRFFQATNIAARKAQASGSAEDAQAEDFYLHHYAIYVQFYVGSSIKRLHEQRAEKLRNTTIPPAPLTGVDPHRELREAKANVTRTQSELDRRYTILKQKLSALFNAVDKLRDGTGNLDAVEGAYQDWRRAHNQFNSAWDASNKAWNEFQTEQSEFNRTEPGAQDSRFDGNSTRDIETLDDFFANSSIESFDLTSGTGQNNIDLVTNPSSNDSILNNGPILLNPAGNTPTLSDLDLAAESNAIDISIDFALIPNRNASNPLSSSQNVDGFANGFLVNSASDNAAINAPIQDVFFLDSNNVVIVGELFTDSGALPADFAHSLNISDDSADDSENDSNRLPPDDDDLADRAFTQDLDAQSRELLERQYRIFTIPKWEDFARDESNGTDERSSQRRKQANDALTELKKRIDDEEEAWQSYEEAFDDWANGTGSEDDVDTARDAWKKRHLALGRQVTWLNWLFYWLRWNDQRIDDEKASADQNQKRRAANDNTNQSAERSQDDKTQRADSDTANGSGDGSGSQAANDRKVASDSDTNGQEKRTQTDEEQSPQQNALNRADWARRNLRHRILGHTVPKLQRTQPAGPYSNGDRPQEHQSAHIRARLQGFLDREDQALKKYRETYEKWQNGQAGETELERDRMNWIRAYNDLDREDRKINPPKHRHLHRGAPQFSFPR